MDCRTVREMALSLPEVEEKDHSGCPSFRVKNKIFSTLWPDEGRAVLKLSPADQAALEELHPDAVSRVAGAWGAQEWTNVRLGAIERGDFYDTLWTAWRGAAPKQLVAAHERSG